MYKRQIVSWPGVVTPDTRCDKYLIIEDFYPTILEMAGITNYKTVNPCLLYTSFEYLRKFGDFPIIKSERSADDYAAKVEANKRKPRNEVARFILEDLNEAIARLLPRSNNPVSYTHLKFTVP